MNKPSPIQKFRARGPLAIFSRPEFKAERFTYLAPTASGLRGLIESVFWKPGVRYQIERVHLLKPIQTVQFRRNEVGGKTISPSAQVVNSGGNPGHLFADDSSNRAQRNTVALRDVDYLVEVRMHLTDKAGPGDNMTKFVDMFQRRIARGSHFQQPYFGCRECIAEVFEAEGDEQPINDTRDLGIMLWDIEFSQQKNGKNHPVFFQAELVKGTLNYPANVASARETLITTG